eukprot:symbB.v1.2.016112.t1/scaffold1219.1/size131098/4
MYDARWPEGIITVAAEADVLQQQASAVASLLQTAMEADPTSRSFDDLTDLLYALDQVCVKLPPGSAPPDFATLNDCSELLQRWLCDAVEASKPEKCLELLHTLSLSRSGSTSLELLETIAAQMLSQSQVLGGAGLVFGLQAFGRLQVLRRTAGNEPQELKLPRLVASLLRSLLVRAPKSLLSSNCGTTWVTHPWVTHLQRAMVMGRSQSMPKLGHGANEGRGHGTNQRPLSGGALVKGKRQSNSCCALQQNQSLAQMPAAVRLEFYRYSTPLKGSMGRINVKQVTKNFKFYGHQFLVFTLGSSFRASGRTRTKSPADPAEIDGTLNFARKAALH